MTVLATYLRPLVAPPTRKAWNGPCVRGPPPGRASSRGSGDRWNHRRRVVSYGDAKRQSIKGGYGALSWRWAGVEDSARRRGGVCHSEVRSRGNCWPCVSMWRRRCHDVSGIEWVTIIIRFYVNYFGDRWRLWNPFGDYHMAQWALKTRFAMTDETKIGSPMRKVVTKVLKVGVVGANSGIKLAKLVKNEWKVMILK